MNFISRATARRRSLLYTRAVDRQWSTVYTDSSYFKRGKLTSNDNVTNHNNVNVSWNNKFELRTRIKYRQFLFDKIPSTRTEIINHSKIRRSVIIDSYSTLFTKRKCNYVISGASRLQKNDLFRWLYKTYENIVFVFYLTMKTRVQKFCHKLCSQIKKNN